MDNYVPPGRTEHIKHIHYTAGSLEQLFTLYLGLSWIYNYLCNQCLSPLSLWVRFLLMARCTRYNIIWSSLFVSDAWVSPGTPNSSTNKSNYLDITEILLRVVLNTITLKYRLNSILKYLTFIVPKLCPFIICKIMFALVLGHYLNILMYGLTKIL